MDKKILIISHGSDADGALPVILTSLVYKNYDHIFLEVDETDAKIEELLDDSKYDLIYMVDLSISLETCNKVMNSKLKDKFKIFDHHISKMEIVKYPFVTLIDINEDGIKECGTTIYYKYLKKVIDNKILDKDVTKEVIELVRQIDTWDFDEAGNMDAKRIADLYGIYGREHFLEVIKNKILNDDNFYYSDQEKYLLEIEDIRIKNYIDKKRNNMIIAKIEDYDVGIVFAERYRSMLGNTLANEYKNLNFIIIIDIDKSISYRSINDNDVSLFAKKYGGGGHKNASGSGIDKNIKNRIIELLFNNIEIK